MNKVKATFAGLFIACLGIGVVNAQTATQTAPAAKQAPAKKSTAKAKSATGTPKTDAAGTSTTKPAQHLKKDGTPDMRYKENKAAAGKTTTTKKAAPKKAAPTTGSNTTGK